MLNLTQGKFVKFSFEKQFGFIKRFKENFGRQDVEKIYKMAIVFKQGCFELMELKLNMSEILVRLGFDSKLIGYVKAVCYFNRRIGRELSGNRNLVLKWNVSKNNKKKSSKSK